MRSWHFVLLLLPFFWSCTNNNSNAEINSAFKKPVIIYPFPLNKPKDFLQPEFIAPSDPFFAGKFKFNDTIKLDLKNRINFSGKDLLNEYSISQMPDSLDVNGLELIADYEKEIYFNESAIHPTWRYDKIFAYYPVYLVNSTNSNKLFFGKEHHGFGIQEAIDTNPQTQGWSPIEYKAIGLSCGNGDWAVIIRPGEFVLLLMKKYRGKIKTKVRARIANGPTIYVSKPFEASINQEQFQPNPFLINFFKVMPDAEPNMYFFGASTRKLGDKF